MSTKLWNFRFLQRVRILATLKKEILTLRPSHIARSPVQELDFVSFVYQWKLDIPAVHQGCYLIEVWLLSVFQSYKFTLVNVSTVKSVILACFHRHMNLRGALAVFNAVSNKPSNAEVEFWTVYVLCVICL